MQNIFKQGHPKGLYLLFFVELWERFSFYGMRALIVLYMVQELLFSTEKAGNIYGLYTGLVYLSPIIGGYLADRFIGQRKCITFGVILMSVGLFMLASGCHSLFFLSLFLMILSNGFFKSNISSVLGLLYGNDNTKKDAGFTIFYMGINLGALLSPLICGTLAYKFGFQYGFASAGFGMLIGFFGYKLLENKYLGEYGMYPVTRDKSENNVDNVPLTDVQKRRLSALFTLMFFTIAFWICFEQAGSSLTLFAKYATDRTFFNIEIPTSYFQTLNPLFIILLAPIMSSLWSTLREKQKEPSSVLKFVIALFLISFSFVLMAYAGHLSEVGVVSPLWLVVAYFIMTIAELCLSPIGLSLVSKLAPRKFLSLTMGTWFLTSFFGNLIAGFMGGKYGVVSNSVLFSILAIISFVFGFILALLMPKLNRDIKD